MNVYIYIYILYKFFVLKQEFGTPYELLQDNPNGIFSQMVNNTGVFMAQSLRDQAENAYLKKTKRTSLDIIQTCPAEDNVTNDIIAQSSL